MSSGNWIIDNLNNALETWNAKLAEIWQIITQSPQQFRGGGIWNVIVDINGALKAIGYALLVLFFLAGVVRTCGSFSEIKRPEQALKLFIRFVLSKAVITYGLDLMMAFFQIVQGIISTAINTAGISAQAPVTMPDAMQQAIKNLGFFDSIPVWAVIAVWQPVHCGSVFYHDPERIRALFQVISLYRHCANPAVHIRRGAI